MALESLFSPQGDTIDITGIEALKKLCKYHPVNRAKFFDGLELAEDLLGAKGVTLYTAGTEITPDRVTRLINLSEASKDLVMKFKIKRSPKLIANFKKDIQAKIEKLIEYRRNFKVYSDFLGKINNLIVSFVDEAFNDEAIILTVFKMKFTADSSENKNASLYFNHTISVALFAFAIAKNDQLAEKIQFKKEDIIDLIKVAFFHNIGAVVRVEEIIRLEEKERKKKYEEFNRSSGHELMDLRLNFDIMDAIRFVGEYHFDRQDFVKNTDTKASWFANIVLVADMYVQQESGLFGAKGKPSHMADKLNIDAMNDRANLDVVQALTLGLNLDDIFDFYQEIESLVSSCEFDGGRHATPYPMTGFKSPTIFICKAHKENCSHYEKSMKAVSLVKKIGDLDEGKYARCMLTTPKLLEFYDEHYEDIKSDQKQ